MEEGKTVNRSMSINHLEFNIYYDLILSCPSLAFEYQYPYVQKVMQVNVLVFERGSGATLQLSWNSKTNSLALTLFFK